MTHTDHRAQLVTEAIVSAYIDEIARPSRRRSTPRRSRPAHTSPSARSLTGSHARQVARRAAPASL